MSEEHPFKGQQAPTPVAAGYQEPPKEAAKPSAARNPFARSRRNQLKLAVFLGGGLILILAVIMIFVIRASRGEILVQATPQEHLAITLNGRATTGVQDQKGIHLRVYAGQYRLKVEKTDFLPYIQDILIKKGQTVVVRPGFAFRPKQNQDETTSIDYVRPSQDQTALFYLGNAGHTIYRMDIATRIQVPLTDKPLKGVSDIQWSGNPDLAIISQADGAYIQEIPKYDFRRQASIKVGGLEVISPVWDPNDTNRLGLVYTPATGEHSLVFTDKRFANLERKVFDIGAIKNPKLVWSPDSRYLLLIGRSSNYDENNIWLYTTADGSLTQITKQGSILDASFAPDSAHILFETLNQGSSTESSLLNIMQVDGSNQSSLKVYGKVRQAAWKNATSFFIPEQASNTLALYSLDGTKEDLSFSLNDFPDVQGMFYFAESKTLIFYTRQTIYTVNLGIE